MTRNLLKHIVISLGIGFIVTTISLWSFRLYEASGMEVMRQFTTWLVASAMYGLISLIYDSNIRFPIVFFIHFIGCAAITFAASIVSGTLNIMQWYEWFLYVLPVFILIYAIIGISIIIDVKCQTKKLNKKMKEKNK